MSISLRRTFAAAAIFAWTAMAHCAEFQPNVTVLSDDIIYNVNADGTFVMDESVSYRVNTDQGVKTRSQLPLSFSASLQDLEVVEAYTSTKDGKRLPVDPDKILLQQSPQGRDAPMFDDGKVKTVVFPGVEIGSTLSLHFRRTQKKALFPGQFSILEAASRDDEYRHESVTVRAPTALKLNIDAVDMQGGALPADKPGTQLWRWTIDNVSAQPREIGSVGPTDRSPRVAVTTFASYQAVAAAYLERAKPKSAVTPAIQTLADQITKGISDPRAQAEALYRWVSTNIRYVAIFLDFGGVVPHEAQSIIDAKYGDCKDHVTVLEALLAAKGIRSSPVLVNATTTYWVPKAALATGVFNHAITYIPQLKLYVDSTAGFAPFGTLSPTEQGKIALVTDDGSGNAMLATLPLYSPESDSVDVTTKLVLDEQGNLTGSSTIGNRGAFDLISRQVFASFPPGMEAQVASRVLTLTGQSGSGAYSHGQPRDLSAPFGYSTQFELPNYAQLPGPGAMIVPQGLTSFSSIAASFEPFAPATRAQPMPVVNRRVTETISIVLPPSMKVPALPKPAHVASPFGTYESSYSAEGQTVTLKRRLDITMKAPLVQPEDYPAFRAMAQDVMRSLRAQLVY